MSRVLIVDDEPESRGRLRDLLVANGHVVTEASNGLDALERARVQPPDLVISDVLMPQMDGFALCRAYRADARLPRAPFLFYTATCTSPRDAALARRLGATRFLVKSMRAEELLRAIADVLGDPRPSGEPDIPDAWLEETESYRLYNETLIQKLEHTNLELQAEVEARRESSRALTPLLAALDAMPSIVSVMDRRLRVIYVNRRFEEVTGYTREEMRDRAHPMPRVNAGEVGLSFDIRATVLAGREWRGETESRRKDGTTFWERVTISPLRDESENISHFLRVAEDITAERRARDAHARAEAQRRRAERIDAVGRVAGGVAHDFNNLLTVVIGHTELALQQLPAEDPVRDDLAVVLDAAARGTSITRQLLTYARRDVVHPVSLHPGQVVQAAARGLQRRVGDQIRLVVSPPAMPWAVEIDPARFDQVIVALVTNARDAIEGEGVITVSLDNETLDDEAAARDGVPAGEYVAIRVADTGSGIADEVLPRVFEPFFTTRADRERQGLGLCTVLGIVEHAGGHVDIERTGPTGTVVRVLLPRTAAPVAPAAPAARTLEGTERILLVEDEPAVLELVRRTLESYGYTVVHAASPDRALRAVEDGQLRVDLVVTDVEMPGMNGQALVQRLRETYPDLRVLFMSGASGETIASHGLDPRSHTLIAKPFTPASLVAAVRRCLDAEHQDPSRSRDV